MGTKLDALTAKMEALQDQIRKEGQEAFNEAIKEVFDAHPEIEAFRWTQYTPYFMDGDPCEFGVNTDVDLLPVDKTPLEVPPELAGSYARYKYQTEDDWYCGMNGMPESLQTAANDFSDCLRIKDLMLTLFGDHVQVTAYRDRMEVEEHQHD